MGPELQESPSSFGRVGGVVLVVLVLVAVALGYFLYQKIGRDTSKYTASQATSTPQDLQMLSPEEREALAYPTDVTEAGWSAYLAEVGKVSVYTDVLTIGQNCAVSPVVLKTQLGKEVTLTNTDSVPHNIGFAPRFLFQIPANRISTDTFMVQVPANGTIAMPIAFGGKEGVYGYGCDDNPTMAGLIQVIK